MAPVPAAKPISGTMCRVNTTDTPSIRQAQPGSLRCAGSVAFFGAHSDRRPSSQARAPGSRPRQVRTIAHHPKTAARQAAPKPSTAEVRAWARAHGITVPGRSKLGPEVWDAWRAAHQADQQG